MQHHSLPAGLVFLLFRVIQKPLVVLWVLISLSEANRETKPSSLVFSQSVPMSVTLQVSVGLPDGCVCAACPPTAVLLCSLESLCNKPRPS